MKNAIRLFLIVAVLGLALQPVAAQDVMIKQKTHTDETTIMGQTQPAKDEIQTIWFTADGVATLGQTSSSIVDFKKKTVININHEEKSYTVVSMDMDKAKDGEDPEKAQAMAGFMKGMTNMEVSVEPLGQKKKIGSWNCEGYKFTLTTMMGPMVQTMYATQNLKIDPSIYRRYMMSSLTMMPGMKEKTEQVAKEVEKIKGIVVRTETSMNMMGSEIKSYSEVLEAKKAKAPANAFAIPAGYKKQGMGSFGF